jgi:hypothetical protein
MVRHATILFAGAASLALSACDSYPGYYDDPRRAWEVTAWASARPDGLYSVRTVTVAPNTCYAPGEIRSAPSTLPQTIELQTNVIRSAYGPCSNYMVDVVHDLPAVRLEPDDRQIEVVVFADGAERNRVRLDVDTLRPIAGPYSPRYDPRDPRYDPRYASRY